LGFDLARQIWGLFLSSITSIHIPLENVEPSSYELMFTNHVIGNIELLKQTQFWHILAKFILTTIWGLVCFLCRFPDACIFQMCFDEFVSISPLGFLDPS
jgi:hypothetical protein